MHLSESIKERLGESPAPTSLLDGILASEDTSGVRLYMESGGQFGDIYSAAMIKTRV